MLLCFCLVESLWFLCFCLVTSLCVFVRVRSFRKKNKKKFKTALITSFTLLLDLSYLQAWIFLITIFFNHHSFFQLSQSFSIITIFFNYQNLFQLSQSFSIITIFFNYHNFFQLSRSYLSQSSLSQSFLICLQLVTVSLWK